MRVTTHVLVLTFATGCAQNVEYIDMNYNFLDEPSKGQIALTYENSSDSPVCMSLSSWPNEKGEVGIPGKNFALIVGDREFPVVTTPFDFCPRCVYFVLPGEKVTAHVTYDSFKLPEELVNEAKALRFQQSVFKCNVPDTCVPDDKIDIGTWTGSRVKVCDE